MRYMLDILDSSKNRTAVLTGLVRARLAGRVNGMEVITAETVEKSLWGYITPAKSFMRLMTDDGVSCGTFRVTEAGKERVRERTSLRLTARHILYDTMHEVFAAAVDCVNYTPADLMSLVLGYSAYNPGTVEPAAAVPFVRFEYEPVIDCLLRICALTSGELALDEDAGEIDLLNQIGSSNGVVFRYGLNLKGASRTVNTARLANRVYGVGGGDPLLTLAGATSSGGNKYASDSASIAAYGAHEAACHEPTLEDTINLVATPALDGVYTDGLCADWTKSGAPAVSKNTNSAYYLYGRASQRVQSAGDGQGVQQTVSVTAGAVYSLSAVLFLTSGTVRVQVADGATVYKRPAPVTGTGMAAVLIENWKANNSSVTVKIIQEGSGSADFYVDSVQIAAGARVKPFTIGKSADILWARTVEFLNAHKNPEISYEIDLVDLYGDTRAGREADKFGLGDTVLVIDPPLGLSVSTRVMEREVDLLRPWRVKVRLDNPSRTVADVLASIREARDRGIQRQRAALAESSRAAEAGSTRLGFKNLSFRFFSAVTVTGWNSLSWKAGTLRVGDAYYAVSSGSATGLSAGATYYFYFDRTSPTALLYTTSAVSAEGEDRILIFAVVTTSSPDPCKVFPMGVIHG